MPKGVIWAGVSAGSNQTGTIVTGQAITSAPAGWGWALKLWRHPTRNTATVSRRAREDRGVLLRWLMQALAIRSLLWRSMRRVGYCGSMRNSPCKDMKGRRRLHVEARAVRKVHTHGPAPRHGLQSR